MSYYGSGKSECERYEQWNCLAKASQQVGWGIFCTMLKYKAEQEGKVYIEVDRFFPTSKTCHVCLNKVGSLSLGVGYWTCVNCGTKHDRDINVAINKYSRSRITNSTDLWNRG